MGRDLQRYAGAGRLLNLVALDAKPGPCMAPVNFLCEACGHLTRINFSSLGTWLQGARQTNQPAVPILNHVTQAKGLNLNDDALRQRRLTSVRGRRKLLDAGGAWRPALHSAPQITGVQVAFLHRFFQIQRA
jgi:hypothetical protein